MPSPDSIAGVELVETLGVWAGAVEDDAAEAGAGVGLVARGRAALSVFPASLVAGAFVSVGAAVGLLAAGRILPRLGAGGLLPVFRLESAGCAALLGAACLGAARLFSPEAGRDEEPCEGPPWDAESAGLAAGFFGAAGLLGAGFCGVVLGVVFCVVELSGRCFLGCVCAGLRCAAGLESVVTGRLEAGADGAFFRTGGVPAGFFGAVVLDRTGGCDGGTAFPCAAGV